MSNVISVDYDKSCTALQVDRQSATEQRCMEVESQIFDLFAQMGASDEQLDFPVLYASARQVNGRCLGPT